MASDNLFKQFWRQLRFDVPRMAAHATSRRRVGLVFLTILLMTLVFTAMWGPIAFFEYKFGGGLGALVACAIIYALAFSLRSGLKKSGNAITLGINTAPLPSLRQAILQQRFILATIINRAAFEAASQSKSYINLETGMARASTLGRLRTENLWETLPTSLRSHLAAPEGSWKKELVGKALLHLDALAVLTWMLNPRSELSSLRTASSEGQEALRLTLLKPDPIANLNFLRSQTELQAQHDPAIIYLKRLSNELIKRGAAEGELETVIEEHAEAYMRYAASVGESEIVAEDLPIGGVLVGEARIDEIFHLRGVAAVRLVTLEALSDALSTNGIAALHQMILSLT